MGIVVDRSGNIFYSDRFNDSIGKVTAAGALTIIAGNGSLNGQVLTPGPALSSVIEAHGLALDSLGNLYVADDGNSDIEKITPDGMLSIIAGKGPSGFENPILPTPGPAVDSSLYYPTSVALDSLGNLYITDSLNFVVEKVAPDGVLSVIAGKPGVFGAATPGPALDTVLGTPNSVTIDPAGNLLVTDLNCAVYRLTPPPTVSTAPRDLHATRGSHSSVALHFAPPLRTGRSPITGYQYSAGGSTWHAATVTGTAPNLSATFPSLAAGHTYALQLRAVNAIGNSPAATTTLTIPAAPVKPTAPKGKPWYVDPLTHTQRTHLPAVPRHPARTHGKARLTKAAYRTHNGTLAVAIGKARGHQLTTGQAVQAVHLFAFDSAKLTAAGRGRLRVFARSLRHTTAITCEGYADYAGRSRHEKRLSERRAVAVCTALHQDRPGLHTRTIGYGRSRPVVIGGTHAQRAANRRVDIRTHS